MQHCLFIALLITVADGAQFFKAHGRVTCGTAPVTDAKIELFDKNSLRRDTKFGEAKPDRNGYYSVEGSTSDPVGDIDPVLKIYHTCVNGKLQTLQSTVCWYKTKKDLKNAKSFINNKQGLQVDVNLVAEKSERDCI